MNQSSKTALFIGVAAVVAVVAWLARPALPGNDASDVRGQKLVADFDPLTAASLEVVDFDEDTSTVRPFQVAQVTEKGKTRWSIPSHDNYPADAKEQLGEAATALLGLKILGVVGDNAGDHELYGVVDPGSKDLKVGSTGVGTRVTMLDKGGKTLLSLIIGKAVPDRPELHYIRRVGEDPVYVVAVKTDKLSGKFGDWIEKNLLNISSWDLKQVAIRDYSVDMLQGALEQNGDVSLSYDDAADVKWKLLKDERFKDGVFIPNKLAADEELNTAKLDEMKTALDDLKIVDVRRKPTGLSADLKGSADFLHNKEGIRSLASCGFYAVQVEGRSEFLSNQGEVRFLMKDGVQYVLRFGANAAGTDSAKKDAKKGAKEAADSSLNRYLLVMAEFNPDAIAKPVPEPLPTEPKTPAAGEGKADKAASKGATAKKDGVKNDAGKKDDVKKDDAKKDDAKNDAGKKDEKKPDLKAERQRVEKENKRKQDEYDEKVAKGKERVKELNARFADWYYVISNDVYRKIHLTRDQMIKKKESKKDANAKDGKGEAAHDHEHGDMDHEHAHDHDGADAEEKSGPVGDLEKLKHDGL
jgi:hypothetical protein